jgi:uncharacterized membrane protein
MPDIGVFHPQLVHFVVALGMIGVVLRLISLTGRLVWTGPAATAMLVIAALASVAAAQSGHEAHGVAERIPGVREAVEEHEELGETTRNWFLVVGALELVALALRKRTGLVRGVLIASGVAGIVACYFLYEAGEHGGRLVYSFAGGVGTRSGDPEDVHRLLIAGLYNQAEAMRKAGRSEEAARLTDELVRQIPDDPNVGFIAVESRLRDRHDAQGALAALDAMPQPADNPRMIMRTGMLRSEILVATGQTDSARAVLTALQQRFPDNPWVGEALRKLK